MENVRDSYRTRTATHGLGQLIIGIAVIIVGVVFALRNFGIPIPNIGHFWPLILILIGGAKLFEKGLGFFWGWALIALGVLYQLDRLDVINFSFWMVWPFFLVALGIHVVRGALKGPRALTPETALSSSFLQEATAFGGGDRRLSTEDFKGGHVTVVFGGFDIDLRDCQMPSGPTVIEVFAMWGGIEIKVPPSWNVSMKVFPMFGGADDKTSHPMLAEDGSPAPQLIISGTVIFGGIDVKN